MDIDEGGGLSFVSTLNNEQINAAVEETLRRIQGLSDGTISAGDVIDGAFQELEKTVRASGLNMSDVIDGMNAGIKDSYDLINESQRINALEVGKLEGAYNDLKVAEEQALSNNNNDEVARIRERQSEIEGEIEVRKQLITENEENKRVIDEVTKKINDQKIKVEENTNAHMSLKAKIKELKEAMAQMIDQGINEQSEAYRRLRDELGRLQDIQGDIATQGKILSNDESRFQGVISGLSGIAGGFSSATGAISLFAGENEDLQKVMTKVQSVMAITIGLQQVSQTLNKDSAFMLVTVRRAKELLTSTEIKFATSLGISNVAARALMATLTLGLSVAITGSIYLISKLIDRQNEAKKAQDELSKAIVEGSYKTIASIEDLSSKWNSFGNDLQAKRKFIEDNKKSFDELGISINGVADAEKLLSDPKRVQAFINAQIEKAKAVVFAQQNAEKVKSLLERQFQVDAMPDKKGKWYGGGMFGGGGSYETENREKLALQKKINEDWEDLKKNGYKNVIDAENKASKELNNAGINNAKEYAKGTIKWYEKAIFEANEAIKNMSNISEIRAKQKEVKKLTNEMDKLAGKTEPNSTVKKDDSHKKIIEDFKNDLQIELDNADSLLKMLEIIKNKKNELGKLKKGKVRDEKNEVLDDKRYDIEKRAKQQTEDLLKDYASSLDKKLEYDKKYLSDLDLLEKAYKEAKTNEEREKINRAKEVRSKEYDKGIKEHAYDSEYAEMLKSYQSFEDKKQSIIDFYNNKRIKAQEEGNIKMIQELNKAQSKDLSSLAMGELQENKLYENLFGNLDELTMQELDKLIALFDNSKIMLGVQLDPKDLEAIKGRVEQVKAEVKERNPFKSLISSIKDYGKATDDQSKKKALTNMFDSASKSIDIVKGGFNDVVGGMQKMGIQMDEETQAIIGDIGNILDSSSQLAQGIASGNPLSIIQGSVGLLTSAFDLFNSKDRKAEKQIKKHAKAINDLERAYVGLEWAINKALGGEVYKQQQAAIDNMKQQRMHLIEMQRAEQSKKKRDQGKIEEYKRQYDDLGRKIEDTISSIAKDITQTDAKSFANELGDALVNAFSRGEDAAKAFETTVDAVIKQALINQLKKNFLERQLEGALKTLENSMGQWNGNEFIFDGLTDAEIEAFKAQVKVISGGFENAMKEYEKIFKDLGIDKDTSLTGAVKGVSEETASLVAGQMNAIRINQIESIAILRQQLMKLVEIANNTRYNKYLEGIYIKLFTNSNHDDLRSKGIL